MNLAILSSYHKNSDMCRISIISVYNCVFHVLEISRVYKYILTFWCYFLRPKFCKDFCPVSITWKHLNLITNSLDNAKRYHSIRWIVIDCINYTMWRGYNFITSLSGQWASICGRVSNPFLRTNFWWPDTSKNVTS